MKLLKAHPSSYLLTLWTRPRVTSNNPARFDPFPESRWKWWFASSPIEKWQKLLNSLSCGHHLTHGNSFLADGDEGLCCWLWHPQQCVLTRKDIGVLIPEHCGAVLHDQRGRHHLPHYLTAAAWDPASHHSSTGEGLVSSHLELRSIDNLRLPGEGESIFFMGVVPERLTVLPWMTPPPRVYRQYYFDSVAYQKEGQDTWMLYFTKMHSRYGGKKTLQGNYENYYTFEIWRWAHT